MSRRFKVMQNFSHILEYFLYLTEIRLTLEGFAECGGWAEAEFRWDLSESSTKCHSFRRYLHLITNLVEDEAGRNQEKGI